MRKIEPIKNWKPKYYKDNWDWKRLKQPQFIVGKSSENEGIEVTLADCSIHGNRVLHIRCYNEGGYNATKLCIKCANSVRRQVPDGLLKAIKKLQKENARRARCSLGQRDEWDKKNNY